jgi:hypothetical protein
VLVFVLNKFNKPLMPCSPYKAKKLLKEGKAKVISNCPFTIKLLHGSSGYKQEVKASIGQITDIERRLENNIKNTVLSENALNKFVILLVVFQMILNLKKKLI